MHRKVCSSRHFIHVRGKGSNPKPLILSHGWPWTFWEYHKLIAPLSDPGSHGGDPADAFDLVVPSLPGYGFSTPLRKPGVNFWRTSGLWVKLMQRLGYPRFAAHGADWGALITADLGHRYPERVMGVHFPMMLPLDLFSGGMPAPEDYDADEAPMAARLQNFFATESAYSALQSTKPQTIASALNDSPVGLASWIVEKQRSWSDCHGDVETRFTKDDLLTTIMIYWVTQSSGGNKKRIQNDFHTANAARFRRGRPHTCHRYPRDTGPRDVRSTAPKRHRETDASLRQQTTSASSRRRPPTSRHVKV
jgi:pimeloyl-ACP methyl ester carboxylesterase